MGYCKLGVSTGQCPPHHVKNKIAILVGPWRNGGSTHSQERGCIPRLGQTYMKALVISVAIIVAGSSALALAWPHPTDPRLARSLDARRHIGRVLMERQGLCFRSRTRDGRQFSFKRFGQGLQQIGAETCPKQFQLAWLDYQGSWLQRARDQTGKDHEALADVALLFAPGGQFVALGDALKQSKRQIGDTGAAWFSVKREAVMFNCPVPADAGNF
jgi:hypothetical protein